MYSCDKVKLYNIMQNRSEFLVKEEVEKCGKDFKIVFVFLAAVDDSKTCTYCIVTATLHLKLNLACKRCVIKRYSCEVKRYSRHRQDSNLRG